MKKKEQMTGDYLALQLHTNGTNCEPGVLHLLRASKLADLCYAYKIRTKPEDKLVAKVALKQATKPSYTITDVTDVVGLRLVALFKCDMVDLFEGVLKSFQHSINVSPNPFIKNGIREIIIYKGSQAFDDLPPKLQEIAKTYLPEITVVEKNSREGYSSIHIVGSLDKEIAQMPSYCLPIEIQIRTVFEDAWGEIDHKYGYLIRSGKEAGKPIANPDSVLSHLKVLKKFTDACMEYADCIRNEAVGPSSVPVLPRKVISVASDEHTLKRFAEILIPETLIDKYRYARLQKEEAIKDGSNKDLFLTAAESFRDLGDLSDHDSDLSSDAKKLLLYYIRMNEAICLMSTNDGDAVAKAKHIYQQLDEAYSDYPLLKMRYGQALGKLRLFDEAIKNLKEAGSVMAAVSPQYIGKPEDTWPDCMPLADYDHMSLAQPKLLGYYLWQKIRMLDSSQEQSKLDLFHEAYSATSQALGKPATGSPEDASLLNNLLYYAVGCLSRLQLKELAFPCNSADLSHQVASHIKALEETIKTGIKVKVTTADTLMKAYHLTDNRTEAKKYAELVINSCLSDTPNELSDSEKVILMKTANKVKRDEILGVID